MMRYTQASQENQFYCTVVINMNTYTFPINVIKKHKYANIFT